MTGVWRLSLAVGILIGLTGGAGWAEEPPRTPTEVGQTDRCPAVAKLGRGLSNVLCGWLEIPSTMEQQYRTSDTATSMLASPFIGLLKGIGRTAVGVYETVTFVVPIPANYEPILPPLEYFTPVKHDYRY